MNALTNISIKARALIAFGLLIALFIGLSGASYVLISKTNNATQDIGTNWMPSIVIGGDLQTLNSNARLKLSQVLLDTTPEQRSKDLEKVTETRGAFAKRVADYVQYFVDDQDRANHKQVVDTQKAYDEDVDSIVAMIKTGSNLQAAQEAYVASLSKYNLVDKAVDQLSDYNDAGAKKSLVEATASYHTAIVVLLSATTGALVVALTSLYMVTSTIAAPIVQITGTMGELAQGKLETAVHGAD
ncbi:MAG: MCP four helix bundle domain-containing protein, partial [Rhodospirillaceae bacterium]